MQFEVGYIPAILLTGMVYLFTAAGLWKNRIKEVYSRRTRREKILTVGILILSVVLMLFIAARQAEELPVSGGFSEHLHGMLLWFLNGSVEILAMAVYFVCVIPVMVISAAALDEIGQKKLAFALPFYYYLLFFMAESLFYKPLATPVSVWFVLLLLAGVLYGGIKMHYEGANKKQKLLLLLTGAAAVLVMILERSIPVRSLCSYAVLFAVNAGAAVVINRASVLKKKIWHAVTLVCCILIFVIGRIF